MSELWIDVLLKLQQKLCCNNSHYSVSLVYCKSFHGQYITGPLQLQLKITIAILYRYDPQINHIKHKAYQI